MKVVVDFYGLIMAATRQRCLNKQFCVYTWLGDHLSEITFVSLVRGLK